MRKSIIILLFLIIQIPVSAQVLGLLKYDGGGDWYSNPTALNNLSNYYNKAAKANSYVFPQEINVENLLSSGISFLHATGHGRIELTESQRSILRLFVTRGGFIHIDDNYGMKDYAEKQLDLCFPNAIKEDVSHSHEIFNSVFPPSFISGALCNEWVHILIFLLFCLSKRIKWYSFFLIYANNSV